MLDDDATESESESEAAEEIEGDGEKKKGGKKKLIITVLLIVVIGYEAASMTILKAPPVTAAQQKEKDDKVRFDLATSCALANGLALPEAPPTTVPKGKAAPKTPPTTAAPVPPSTEGPVLTLDSVTVNLNDGHFLKLGLGLQLTKAAVLDTAKSENIGSAALGYVLDKLRHKTMADLGPRALEPLREQLGYDICSSDAKHPVQGKAYDATILTVYFTDFVMQ
jgi:flagellar basal body-associated protein FliL